MPVRGATKRMEHLREIVTDYLEDTCAIVKYIRDWDAAGGWSESYETIATYPCRLDPTIYYRTEQAFGQETTVVNYILSVPYNADVPHDHRILIRGKYYDVVRAHDNQTNRLVKRLLVSEVVYEPDAS